MHNVLILGAGLVSRPIVRYFLDAHDCRLIVASLDLSHAETLLDDHPSGEARQIDVSDPAQLEPLIREADLVISLVPYAFHVQVSRCAIRHGVNVITASYVAPEMRALDAEARAAGVTILNEVGLDPGLDHMSAMRLIDGIHDDGGTVVSFSSCCGGLPAPEAADNPWKYKFSWSPRGALLAGKLPARFLDDGRTVSIPGESLFAHSWPYAIDGVGPFEIYPNRDSLKYVEPYGLRDVRTMLRATVRYEGWCETMRIVTDLGLLDIERRTWEPTASFATLLDELLPGDGPLRERLARRYGLEPDSHVLERFEWAGLFSDEPLGANDDSRLDLLAARFESRMAYRDGERDMVVQRHELVSRGGTRGTRRYVSQLVAFGEPGGDSATARTVSLPAAVAGRLLLDGTLSMPGVQIPTSREIYQPILDGLEPFGIAFDERVEAV